MPPKEPSVLESVQGPLLSFILYASVPYLTLMYYQTKWEIDELKIAAEENSKRFEQELEEILTSQEKPGKINQALSSPSLRRWWALW